jgi:hypothetical protein
MHGSLTEEGENGDFPNSEFEWHIAHMNYIERAIRTQMENLVRLSYGEMLIERFVMGYRH